MEQLKEYKCPRCINEILVKMLGNLLVCPECELQFVTKNNVNDFVGRVETLEETLEEKE